MARTRSTRTSVAALSRCEIRFHAPSSRKTATPATIHRTAHRDGSAERRLLRSIFRFLSSASMALDLPEGGEDLLSRSIARREESADTAQNGSENNARQHDPRADVEVEGHLRKVGIAHRRGDAVQGQHQ